MQKLRYIKNTGNVEKTAGRMTARCVSIRFIPFNTRYDGSIMTLNGISIKITYVKYSAPLPRKENFANAHAAGIDTSICPSRMHPTIFTEFQNTVKNSGV